VSDEDRPRRFGRRRTDAAGLQVESLVALRAELLLLREENARLKAAPHRGPDVGAVLGQARSIPGVRTDDDIADETTRVLVEGLVIRESLLELCNEIERAMVAFEARLTALQPPAIITGSNGNGGG
jgi:hypothetical protein